MYLNGNVNALSVATEYADLIELTPLSAGNKTSDSTLGVLSKPDGHELTPGKLSGAACEVKEQQEGDGEMVLFPFSVSDWRCFSLFCPVNLSSCIFRCSKLRISAPHGCFPLTILFSWDSEVLMWPPPSSVTGRTFGPMLVRRDTAQELTRLPAGGEL